MEKNTVTISLEDYNDLRDFRMEMTESSKVAIFGNEYPHSKLRFVTKDQAVIELAKETDILKAENSRLMRQLLSQNPQGKSINDIKKMSIWQFLKWRNK